MNPRGIVAALGGRSFGSYGLALCPAHEDRRPSLSVTERAGKVLVKCHAGCPQQVTIAALQERRLWHGGSSDAISPPPRGHHITPEAALDERGIEHARRLWASSLPAAGTPVAEYLRGRAIDALLPPTIRFHPRLWHRPSGSHFPAMIAAVTVAPSCRISGIHRTWLAHDDEGWRKASIESNKMMLGPCCGGAVQLGQAGKILMVGEGIETCLSAMQATTLPAWAALSTSGLRSLILPNLTTDLIILADGDDAGEAAAHDCGARWKREGRCVRIARPPHGTDFNDLLKRGGTGSGTSSAETETSIIAAIEAAEEHPLLQGFAR